MQNTTDPILLTIEEARLQVPEQGPLSVFIHQNNLQSLEDINFFDAVENAAAQNGAEPYLSHLTYIELWNKGRITNSEIEIALEELIEKFYPEHKDQNSAEMSSSENPYWTREVWMSLLRIPFEKRTRASIPYLLKKEDLPLWNELLKQLKMKFNLLQKKSAVPQQHLGLSPVDEETIVFVSAFLDQGLASWPMPHREKGLLQAYLETRAPKILKMRPDLVSSTGDAYSLIKTILTQEDMTSATEIRTLVLSELLALPGWAGMMNKIEKEPDLLPYKKLSCSLLDYLAVRLLIRLSLTASLGKRSVLAKSKQSESLPQASPDEHLWMQTWHSLRILKEPPFQHFKMSGPELGRTLDALLITDDIFCRRVLHQAFESTYQRELSLKILNNKKWGKNLSRTFQAVFCLDEREESFRRHLENSEPTCETFGAAGFFGVAMSLQALGEKKTAPFCPIVINPKTTVKEVHSSTKAESTRARLRQLSLHLFDINRQALRGSLLHLSFGFLSLFPLLAKIFFPQHYGKFIRTLRQRLSVDEEGHLHVENFGSERSSGEESSHLRISSALQENTLQHGFQTHDMADKVYDLLQTIGLNHFSPLIFIVGHGSHSLNNPHRSAYECGACGGRRGGTNARAFAYMANQTEVRKLLAQRGIHIPDETVFIGANHDTCSDELRFYDTTNLSPQIEQLFKKTKKIFYKARSLNAFERSRRFASAKQVKIGEAIQHVEKRALSLAEPRPEYGHATNASCLVGSRELSRGLDLSRRSFLVSYEHQTDKSGDILLSLLNTIIPVCAGINLEYYFSCVDNEVYGAGTKLPHNPTGLIGVMNGALSDLRTGLVRQMIEIHEPLRLFTLLEARKEQIEYVLAKCEVLARMTHNEWIQLAWIEPGKKEIQILKNKRFEIYASSV